MLSLTACICHASACICLAAGPAEQSLAVHVFIPNGDDLVQAALVSHVDHAGWVLRRPCEASGQGVLPQLTCKAVSQKRRGWRQGVREVACRWVAQ